MSEFINEINKISVNSSLKLRNVNMTTLLFSDNLLCPRNSYTITDNMLIVKDQPYTDLDLFQFIDTSNYYEYLMNLTTKGVVISGKDRFGNELDHLSDTVLVFINGYKITSAEYIIDKKNNTITIKSAFNEKVMSNVIVYTSDAVYEGNVEDDFSWNPEYNQFLLKDYTIERYIFFKNGELLSPDKIQKVGSYVRLNTVIKHGVDLVEYYRMSRDCYALTFTPDIGYLTYGPKDDRGTLVQNPYDCIITLDNIARLAIDDVRTGFFVHEVYGDGCVMMVDDDFETRSIKCLTIHKFKKETLDPTEYFLTVPDAPSIIKYVSDYDLNGTLFKELLASFQKVLLNETYDSIKRIANIRNINKVDSANISAMINFLGLRINVTNLTLDKKHNLIEELRTFYDTVGTRASYNFYNAFKNDGKIINIQQLFTPMKSTEDKKKKNTFFDRKWGELIDVKQTVSNSEDHRSYVYIWSLHFANGYVLPVVIRPDATVPSWNFSYIEETDKTSYNSAVWRKSTNVWINAVASDPRNMMLWSRDSVEIANKDYDEAIACHWDEDRLVNGRPSVNTNRFKFTLKDGVLTVRDTYRNITLGSWDSYISEDEEQIDPTEEPVKRYVTFRTAEELGAILKQKFITDVTDFGQVSELAQDAVNLSNTPRFEGVLRYSNFPILTQGILDRYHPSESGPYLSEDEINLSLIVNSLTKTAKISEDKNYECEITDDNKILLKKYVGTNSNVIVPNSLTYEDKKVAEVSVIPTNLNVNLYNSEGKRVKLYNYEEETNTYSYIIEENSEYHYEVIDKKKNILFTHNLEDGDQTISTILPLINDYTTNPQVGPNPPSIDCGYITEDPVDFYDFGSVADQLDGHWVSWYEWDSRGNWYPTNHVDVSVEIPFDVDYETFMNVFKDTFYEIASAVLYIHEITQIYMFGNPDNMGDTDVQPMSLITTCPYETEEQCFTNDHNFLPYKKAIGNKPLTMQSYMFKNPRYQFENNNLIASVDLYTNYGRDEELYKETGEEKDIEWTETLTGTFPCRQLNYTDWTKEQDTATEETGEVSWNQLTNIPKFTVTCIPYVDDDYVGFFPKTWGKLQYISQTLTLTGDLRDWCYAWSLHFYNDDSNKYYVLPVILTRSNPDTPIWNFNNVEECDRISYDRYNSAYYYDGLKNAVAEDGREWMQWSNAGTGSSKLAYGTIKYRTAEDKNWDEGHKINGHCSTQTSRYNFTLSNGELAVIDTYTSINVGSWSSYASGSYIKHIDWMYSLVINYDNKEEGYIISKDLQNVSKVAETNLIQKLQTVENGKIEYVRPNSVFYEKDRWYLSYVTYDSQFKVYEWKLPTLSNENPESELENLKSGIGECYRKYASEINWNNGRPGSVIVNSKSETKNNKLYITVDTNEDPLMYKEINKNFDLNNGEFTQSYSYTHNNTTWSCDLTKFNVYNNVQLDLDNEKNSTTLLLPVNISYHDKNRNLRYNFGDADYIFSKIRSSLDPIKEEETEHEEKAYYKYTNFLSSNVNQSLLTFNTYGTLLTSKQIIFKDIDYLCFGFDHLPGHGKHLDVFVRITNSKNPNYNGAVGYYASRYTLPSNGKSGGNWDYDVPYDPTKLMQWCRHNQGNHEGSPWFYTGEDVIINITNFSNDTYKEDFDDEIIFDLYCAINPYKHDSSPGTNLDGLVAPEDISITARGYKNGTIKWYPARDVNLKNIYKFENVDENGNVVTPVHSDTQPLHNFCITKMTNMTIGPNSIPENTSISDILRKVATITYTQSTKEVRFEITPNQDS